MPECVLHFLRGGFLEYPCGFFVASGMRDLCEVAILDMRIDSPAKADSRLATVFISGRCMMFSLMIDRVVYAHGCNLRFAH